MKIASILCASTALLFPAAAFAQSTGTIDFEEEAIVVTGTRNQNVGGVIIPDSPKARQVLTQDTIARQNPGQSILDTINLIPGVSFTNNDAYGSAGGQLTIRGFSADRISLTVDGIPTNDTGSYAIYSNQQLDPELIEQVNVNLGSTDVDSPTASASGSTVNYRTRIPGEDLGGMVSASYGEFNFHRVFGMLETGNLTSFGTRAWIAASKATNDVPFNNYGKVDKQQYNARIYQPLGSNGDFISLTGHYNQNRNNFFGSVPLRLDADRVVGPNSSNRFPRNTDEREYVINYPCETNTVARAGIADTANSCGTEFDRRYNPSNTGRINAQSRFTLADSLVLTVDPSYQYTKANGGGTTTARETGYDVNNTGGRANCATTPNGPAVTCLPGYLGGSPYFGRDLNGDGDLLDTVTMSAPNQTRTHRYVVISNLLWDINDNNTFRVGYTFDRGNHRQTGQVGGVRPDGEPVDVFPVNISLEDVNGVVLNRRDRQSYATLHQAFAEYRGEFVDNRLVVTAGLTGKWFKRDLTNNCFTTSDTGFFDCFGSADDPRNATYAGINPTVQGPQQRILKYDDILPSLGATFDLTPALSLFGNYSKGIQVPGTDALYNAFYFAPGSDAGTPTPETTNNFDLGVRYRSSKVQAFLSGWYTRYDNRLATAYDPDTERNVYRNLGRVNKAGVDGSIAYQPNENLFLNVFGSYIESEIQDDVLQGTCTAAQVTSGAYGCTTAGAQIFTPTAGKREGGAPVYTYGGSVRGFAGPFELGVTAKRTGGRYIYDTNDPVRVNGTLPASAVVYPDKTNAYWLVNLDARLSLREAGLENTYIQLNVYNLFDELYVGNYTPSLFQGTSSAPNAQIGAPRTVSATLTVGF